MIIDFHAHFIPAGYAARVRALADSQSDQSPRSRSAWVRTVRNLGMDSLVNIELRLAEMDRLGIDLQILSLAAANVLPIADDLDVELAREANDGIAETVALFPERFVGLATLPLGNVDLAVAELERATGQLGLRGIILGTSYQGAPLDCDRLDPLFDSINRRSMPVLLHPTIPPGIESMNDYNLEAGIGYLFDTTLAAARIVMDGVLARHPNIRLVVPHLGGAIPFIQSRIDNACRQKPEHMRNIANPPSEFFRKMYYDCVSSYMPALTYTLAYAGADRILFGTDMPHTAAGTPDQLLANLNNLDDQTRRRIASENALSILGN